MHGNTKHQWKKKKEKKKKKKKKEKEKENDFSLKNIKPTALYRDPEVYSTWLEFTPSSFPPPPPDTQRVEQDCQGVKLLLVWEC